ncbi:MAG: KUP/HAK/KT family potassium transporter [Acetobacteraceae bacterium]|nr:KUP/HAK/KT family potassium transporter [Acetobacteraceae bacterium]
MMDSALTLPAAASASPTERRTTGATALAALGIVYGDLGTSPLYTYQTIVGSVGGHPSAEAALGLLSLVVWALIITVSIKYCVFVMRADNHGEGGILALMSLVTGRAGHAAGALVAMGLFGAALIYGDGIITPAISVLSALEGINVATDAFKPYVLPAALVVLLALFAAQTRGTASIGRVFGPVMLIWFVVIAVLGLSGAVRHPEVVAALDPWHALRFLATDGWHSFIVLGGVFLAITGGEALYADMGHIGRSPIRSSWYCVVLPALLLSYAGQTALLIENPALDGNPFFKLAPGWAVIPLVVLATAATIIASQAIITGAFSLTRQAMQLGWFPGLNIRQTSDEEYGQIYVPFMNWTMMILTLALTYGFGSSDRLAAAYGTAVSTTMWLTTALLYTAMREVWRWPAPAAILAAGLFLLVDLAFFGANLLKLPEGGWVPLILGAFIFAVMTTWHRGMVAVKRKVREGEESSESFLGRLKSGHIPRVPGTAVFLSRSGTVVPPVMVRHVAQFKALQETVVSLAVHFAEVPRISVEDRAEAEHVADNFWHVIVRFGFVEIPNLATALACAKEKGCPLDLEDAIYFAAHDEVVRSKTQPRLPGWRRMLFSFMYRNAVRAPDRFDLPADKFVEIGRQVAL